jgi:2-iminobutanoate/2-iminopropanoate deaminase
MTRQLIHVDGLGHGNQPIPLAVRIGPLLVSGSISGRAPETGQLPDDVAQEIAQAFENLAAVLREGGLGLDDVAKVDVALRAREDRQLLNEVWVSTFPNEHDRPVRHVTTPELPSPLNIQLAVLAYAST